MVLRKVTPLFIRHSSTAFIASEFQPGDVLEQYVVIPESIGGSFSNYLTLPGYVEGLLTSGKISDAAILGQKGGVWATSDGFKVYEFRLVVYQFSCSFRFSSSLRKSSRIFYPSITLELPQPQKKLSLNVAQLLPQLRNK
jgi:hypothetical protein